MPETLNFTLLIRGDVFPLSELLIVLKKGPNQCTPKQGP